MDDLRFFRYGMTELVIIRRKKIDFDEHCHCFDFVVTMVTDGTAQLVHNGRNSIINTGEVFTVRPYEAHSLSSDTPVSLVSLCIDKTLFGYERKAFSEVLSSSLDRLISAAGADEYRDILLQSTLALYDDKADEITDEYVLSSRSSIEEHPEREYDLDHYADKANYSKYHFIRRFRKAAGLTPHRFIIQNRIRKAQRLLDDGSRITETAVSVGFYDQSHFDKYFKKIVGISPKEYISSIPAPTSNFLQE